MKKVITGYAAFDKASGKGLSITFGTTNRLHLTTDPDKVYISDTAWAAEHHIIWYNNSHKNQKEFEIKKVAVVTEIIVQ